MGEHTVIHRQTFVESQFFSVAKHARCFKLRLKPGWLYVSRIFYPRAIEYIYIYIYIYMKKCSEGVFIYIYIYIHIYDNMPTFDVMTLWRGCGKQTIFLFVLAQNQTKPELEISTRREVGKETRVRVGRRNPRRSSWRRVAQRGSRHRLAEKTSQHEIESRISEGRPVKMSQHSSWLCRNFARNTR